MDNLKIKKLISQCHERHPNIDPDIIRKIWLDGYSTGLKGKIKRPNHNRSLSMTV
jgi:hypothetical protein